VITTPSSLYVYIPVKLQTLMVRYQIDRRGEGRKAGNTERRRREGESKEKHTKKAF